MAKVAFMGLFIIIGGEILATTPSSIKRISKDSNNNITIEFSDGQKKIYPFDTVEDQESEFDSFADTLEAIDVLKPEIVSIEPQAGSASIPFTLFVHGINFDPSATISLNLGSSSNSCTVVFGNSNLLIVTTSVSSGAGVYDVVYSDSNISPNTSNLKASLTLS